MLQGIWDSWASGANQDAANEALRTGNPVNMGLLENFYGNKEDAENIVKKAKQDQLKSTYGSALAEVGLMVDWGEDEQSVKSKLFKRRQDREAGQAAKRRAEGLVDARTAQTNALEIGQQGINAANDRFSTQLESQRLDNQANRDQQSAQYAHTSKMARLDRSLERELSQNNQSMQLALGQMNADLADKRMEYDRETARMDRRSAAIAQLMSGLGSLGGAFAL